MRLAHLALAGLALAAFPAATPAQPLKSEVDGLVAKILGLPPLDAGIPPQNAKEAALLLLALRHCHRGYDREDMRWLRGPLEVIFKERRADGLFGRDQDLAFLETTTWVYLALHDLDAEHYAEDLRAVRKALDTRTTKTSDQLAAIGHQLWHSTPNKDWIRGKVPTRDIFVDLLALVVEQRSKIAKQNPSARATQPWEPFQQKALDWLVAQSKDGMWLVPLPDGKVVPDPGISALALAAVAAKPKSQRSEAENALLGKGIDFLLAAQKQAEHGAFSSHLPNYVTCVAILALARADTGRDDVQRALQQAQKYLVAIQNVERAGVMTSDRDYGSIGYGGDRRGDLSNTQMALEGLRLTGLAPEDEVFAKALVYLQRLQNVPGSWRGSMTMDGKKYEVVSGSDGGAAYYPGNSAAGYDETSEGKLVPRSYGSMTYALLKCYVLCGVPKDDPRLQAALNWCFDHYTLDVNPGSKPELGEKEQYQGLYYYYLTLARALHLAEVDQIKDKDWRKDLRAKLQAEQREDGSWVNDKNGRWWEDNPIICTAYALIALSE